MIPLNITLCSPQPAPRSLRWLVLVLGLSIFTGFLATPTVSQADETQVSQRIDSARETDGIYPDHPIRLIAPWGRGGSSDTAARLLASVATRYLGQPLVVENRTGNGGMKGANYVHKAKGDGYTLLLARIGNITGPAAKGSAMPYEYNDFTMLGLLEINPVYCFTALNSPYDTIQDVLDDIAKRPGQVRYVITGEGSIQHFVVLKLLSLAGFEDLTDAATPVVYPGGGGRQHEGMLRGEVDFECTNLSGILPYIRDGLIKPLMSTNIPERLTSFPDVPTAAELGFEGLKPIVGWSALFGPPEMKPDAVRLWEKVLRKIADDPAWKKPVVAVGSIPLVLSPKATRKFVEAQYGILGELVKDLDR